MTTTLTAASIRAQARLAPRVSQRRPRRIGAPRATGAAAAAATGAPTAVARVATMATVTAMVETMARAAAAAVTTTVATLQAMTTLTLMTTVPQLMEHTAASIPARARLAPRASRKLIRRTGAPRATGAAAAAATGAPTVGHLRRVQSRLGTPRLTTRRRWMTRPFSTRTAASIPALARRAAPVSRRLIPRTGVPRAIGAVAAAATGARSRHQARCQQPRLRRQLTSRAQW
mmetsp:Transcript_45477/g.125578  ORF Transcript_45477/g.125578 Transcript_45477/m.125578 type:complete len:231 (+) Transcript_45477:719-1411(+)